MAVTALRTFHTESVATITQFGTLSFTGTYTTGGDTINIGAVPGPTGTSTISGTSPYLSTYSPLNYSYVLVGSGATAKIKVMNGTTELANAASYPEASVPFSLETKKI